MVKIQMRQLTMDRSSGRVSRVDINTRLMAEVVTIDSRTRPMTNKDTSKNVFVFALS